jgi:hypothetical protein
MNFKGEAIRATEASIAVIAAELGVPYARLRGVIQVEAPGGAFDRQGRPTMLFEPHHFYKRVRADKRDEAVRRGVAQPNRPARGTYPPESYTRMAIAYEIDPKAALESASWGRGQLMGFNYADAGYRSAQAMVEAFMRSESEQLRAMGALIRKWGLIGSLKRGDAEAFALRYNGSGYKRDGYHTKIRAAWRRWEAREAPPVARETEREAPPRTMATSKEGNAAVAGGAIAGVTAATEVGKQVKDATDTATGLVEALTNPVTLALVAVAIIAAAIWFWRKRRMDQEAA